MLKFVMCMMLLCFVAVVSFWIGAFAGFDAASNTAIHKTANK